MKKHLTIIVLILFTVQAYSQSDSYITFKDTFKGAPEVHSFSFNGFICRTALAWSNEREWQEAITDIKNVRFVVIPKGEFKRRHVTLSGFKKILAKDSFQELGHVRDSGDVISFYLQENGKNDNRYFILVEENDEVVAIEMRGTIDMNMLMKSMEKDVASK